MLHVRRDVRRLRAPRNLAAAEPGERVRIRRIHFDVVRELCAELGIREGDHLRCLRHSAGEVVVEFPESHTAALSRRHARFVELEGASPLGLLEAAAVS